MPTLLICLLVLPVATAVVVALLGPQRGPAIRSLSLACTLVCLVLAVVLVVDFAGDKRVRTGLTDTGPNGALTFRPHERSRVRWDLVTLGQTAGGTSAIRFDAGLDGLNVWLVLLTAVLLVPSVLVSWRAITERVHEFYAWLLVLETSM